MFSVLCSAQAFHGAFENFVTWLRTKERKIQRDDPIKLEEEDLEAGLKHLKVSVLSKVPVSIYSLLNNEWNKHNRRYIYNSADNYWGTVTLTILSPLLVNEG